MSHHGHGHGGHEEEKKLSLFASPLIHKSAGTNSPHRSSAESTKEQAEANTLPLAAEDEALHDTPEFHRHAEATTIELFYDLFFVANLTTFTANLYINSSRSKLPFLTL